AELGDLLAGDDVAFLAGGGFYDRDLGLDGDGGGGFAHGEPDAAEIHDFGGVEDEAAALQRLESRGYDADGVSALEEGAELERAIGSGGGGADEDALGFVPGGDFGIGDEGVGRVNDGALNEAGLGEGYGRGGQEEEY